MPAPASVDAYLAALPADKRATLQKVRAMIKAAAPKAEEGISYGIPTFKLHGRMLGSYGAAAKHCALYGFVGLDKALVKDYDMSPGTIRFPVGQPLPASLVKLLVKGQVARVEAALAATGKKTVKKASGKSIKPAVKQAVNKSAAKAAKTSAKK
jgi:uncharacterized protein YdhG (YjbR/CyaY superfamily)